jgi:hypothetical protein
MSVLLHVNAGSVQFFYDRFLLEADGDVRVTTSDGMTMTGDSFSMNLKLNRFVLAGHVHVQDPAGSQDGAALADFLDFNRIYFVPVTSEPDRWTFIDGDFAHPAKGREMPGDVFEFPDLGESKPFIMTDSATVGARSFVRFGGNHLDVANGMGAYVPTPSYYVNFSSDQHLGDNSLAGASFDATDQFAGNANSISALHFRYDPTNKTYLSFEQHFSGKKAYAVFSVNPLTKQQKFWDLVMSDRPSDRFQIRTFTQLATYQHGLSLPSASGQFTTVQATQALPHSFVQLNTQFTNYSLLAPTYALQFHHPFETQLVAQTFDNRIGKLPLYEHLQLGIGMSHDAYGLQTLGGVTYKEIWNHFAGLQMYVPSLKIGNSPIESKNYYVNATFQKTRTWNSTPHYVDVTDTNLTLSKTLDRHFLAYAGYEVENTGDYYQGVLASQMYTPFVPVVNGVPVYGYAAFHGVATFRTLSLDLNYTNNGNFSASLLARKHVDFPRPYPGLFQAPPLNILGQQMVPNYLGEAPYDLTADVRFRVNTRMSIDLARSYFFNFGNQRWSPSFVLQVTQ